MTELTDNHITVGTLDLGPKPPSQIRSDFIPFIEHPQKETMDERCLKVSGLLNRTIAVMKERKQSTATYTKEYGLDNSFPPTEDMVAEAFLTGVASGDFIVALHPYPKPDGMQNYYEVDQWERKDEQNPGKTKPAIKVVFFQDFLSGVPQTAQEQVMTAVVMDSIRKDSELMRLGVMKPTPASAHLNKQIEGIHWQTPFLPK